MMFFVLLFWLIVGHALGDFPLQGDYLAQAKNRNLPLGKNVWPWCLGAHCVIQAGFVAFITGSILLGLAEGMVHVVIDWLKCENKITYSDDQIIHLACKVCWAALAVTLHSTPFNLILPLHY